MDKSDKERGEERDGRRGGKGMGEEREGRGNGREG